MHMGNHREFFFKGNFIERIREQEFIKLFYFQQFADNYVYLRHFKNKNLFYYFSFPFLLSFSSSHVSLLQLICFPPSATQKLPIPVPTAPSTSCFPLMVSAQFYCLCPILTQNLHTSKMASSSETNLARYIHLFMSVQIYNFILLRDKVKSHCISIYLYT